MKNENNFRKLILINKNISLHWHYPTGYKGLSYKTYSQPFKAPLIF